MRMLATLFLLGLAYVSLSSGQVLSEQNANAPEGNAEAGNDAAQTLFRQHMPGNGPQTGFIRRLQPLPAMPSYNYGPGFPGAYYAPYWPRPQSYCWGVPYPGYGWGGWPSYGGAAPRFGFGQGWNTENVGRAHRFGAHAKPWRVDTGDRWAKPAVLEPRQSFDDDSDSNAASESDSVTSQNDTNTDNEISQEVSEGDVGTANVVEIEPTASVDVVEPEVSLVDPLLKVVDPTHKLGVVDPAIKLSLPIDHRWTKFTRRPDVVDAAIKHSGLEQPPISEKWTKTRRPSLLRAALSL